MHHSISFKRIYVEITNLCNKNCAFCPKTNRVQEFLLPAKFEYIIDQIKHLTNNLCLHVMGEPLLHPNLNEILSICDKNNMRVNIVTNGTLIGEKLNVILQHASVQKLTISLHSFEANKTTQELTNYVNSCLQSADILAKINKICELRLWNLDSETKNGLNNLNNDILSIIFSHYNTQLNKNNVQQKNITLSKNIFLGLDQIFDWPNENNKICNKIGFCFGLRTHFGILVDGTVVPCCLDNNGTINLGNIFKTNIDEILNGERAKNIYKNFSNREICEKLCTHCGFIKKFNKKDNI